MIKELELASFCLKQSSDSAAAPLKAHWNVKLSQNMRYVY